MIKVDFRDLTVSASDDRGSKLFEVLQTHCRIDLQ